MLKVKIQKFLWFIANWAVILPVLRRSRLFDAVFYAAHNRDQVLMLEQSYFHYSFFGAWSSKWPHPLIDPNFYLAQVPWLRKYKINPVFHYALGGHFFGINPHPLFNTSYIRGKLPWYERWRNPLVAYLKKKELWESPTHPYFAMETFIPESKELISKGTNPLKYFSLKRFSQIRRKMVFDCQEKIRRALQEKNIKLLLGYYDLMSGLEPFFQDNLKERRMLSWSTLQSHAAAGSKIMKSWPEQTITVAPVDIRSRETKELPGGVHVLPASYVAALGSAEAISATRYVFQNDTLLHDELPFYREKEFEPKYLGLKYVQQDTAMIKYLRQWGKKIPSGIVLSVEHEANYFHWIVEVLPKLLLIEEAGVPKDVPLIVDSMIHENLMTLLNVMNIEGRPILRLGKHQLLSVEKLYYASDLSRLLDRYVGDMKFNDCVIGQERVRQVRDRLIRAFGLTFDTAPFRNVYFLRRRNSLRKIYGEDKLLDRIMPLGFEPVIVDELPIKYQLLLMTQAKHVLGPTGAAFTNMLFCHPETKVTIMNSLHPLANLYVYNQIGQIAGVDLKFVLGKTVSALGGKFGVHDDYEVDVDLVLETINR